MTKDTRKGTRTPRKTKKAPLIPTPPGPAMVGDWPELWLQPRLLRWTAPGGRRFAGSIRPPLIGSPRIIPKDGKSVVFTVHITEVVAAAGGKLPIIAKPDLTPRAVKRAVDFLASRCRLQAVGKSASGKDRVRLAAVRRNGTTLEVSIGAKEAAKLVDRQLYSIVVGVPGDDDVVISNNSVYVHGGNWKDFNFMHVTDIHVARRNDEHADELRALAKQRLAAQDAARRYANPNAAFRRFIRYANDLHARGALDFIIATGDLVDFGTADDGGPDDNFRLFKELLVGDWSGIDGAEPLQVPIFTVLGNHDYRTVGHRLIFDVEVDVELDLGLFDVGFNVHKFRESHYGGLNLTKNEAKLLEGARPSKDGTLNARDIDDEEARHFVTPSEAMIERRAFYFDEICREESYVLRFGPHRFAMVNTKHDSGVTGSEWKVIKAKLGMGDRETRRFVAGFVNSEGFDEANMRVVKEALDGPKNGIVVVAMHAPPLCHANKEYSHFFRETEHTMARPADTVDFLIRNHGPSFISKLSEDGKEVFVVQGNGFNPVRKFSVTDLSKEALRGWSLTGTPYFRKAFDIDDSIGGGVADESSPFLRLASGAEGGRPVTLVLCGHNHSHLEYRLRWDSEEEEVEYYMDFYTENPDRYYDSREFGSDDWIPIKVGNGGSGPEGARTVPRYADPLSRSPKPKDWWQRHAPIVAQTACLGPVDSNNREEEIDGPPEPRFRGGRLVKVRANVITKVRLVTVASMRQETKD